MIRYWILLFFTCLVVSCNCKEDFGKYDNYRQIEIQFNKNDIKDTLCLSDLFSEVQYILLEQTLDNNPIGVISDVKVIKESIYIHDSQMHRILHYDISGSYLGQISSYGRGPGEYLNIDKFDVNLLNGEISILDLYSKRIFVYSSAYEYIRSFSIIDVPRDFAILTNGNYVLFTPDYMKDVKYGLWMTDSHGNFIEDLLKIPSSFKYHGGIYEKYFHRYGNTIYIYPSVYYDNIYHIESDSISITSHLDIDIKIPKRVIRLPNRPLGDYAGQIYTIRMCFEVDNWILVEAYDMQKLVGVIYDKRNDKTFYYYDSDDIVNDMPYSGQFVTTTDNALVGIIYPDIISAYQPLAEQFPDTNEYTNPIIAISYTK